MRMPPGGRWASNNYITRCHRWLGSVSLSSVPVTVGDRMPVEWEPAPDRGLGPSATQGWAAQPRWGRSAAMVTRRTLGQYVAICLCLQLTSYTQLTSTLSNKVWEVYFYKEVCLFVHWSLSLCLIMFRMYCVYICGYITFRNHIFKIYTYQENEALNSYNDWYVIKPNQTKPNQTKPILFIACSYFHFLCFCFLSFFFLRIVQLNRNDFSTNLFNTYMGP